MFPAASEQRVKKKKSRWGGSENDKTFIPGMPTILPASMESHQQEAYLGNYLRYDCVSPFQNIWGGSSISLVKYIL